MARTVKSINESEMGRHFSVRLILKDGSLIGYVLILYGLRRPTVTVEVYENYKLIHRGQASGGGYDKFTAALRGCVFAGHRLTNHCEERLEKPKDGFPGDFPVPIGYQLANLNNHGNYDDCYRRSGLDYLTALGYTIKTIL